MDQEIQEGDDYDKLPYLDERETGRDFMDFYREVEDWDEFESELLDELLDNPGWLLDKEPELAQIALEVLRASRGSGEAIKDRLVEQVDERIIVPLFLRAIELFSKKEGFKYLWSSASYENVENQENFLMATFDISLDEAKKHYYSGLTGKRKEPCLVRLSIESLVNKYRLSGRHEMELFFEHAPESFFDSVDLKLDLDGLDIVVYKGIKDKEKEEGKVEKNETEIKFYEVLTNEAMVIGPDDIECGVEASPLNCGILTFVDEQRHIVGMAHCDRFIDEETADKLISTVENGFRERGGSLNEIKIEGYNFLNENLDTMLESIKRITGITPQVYSELIMGTTIRVDKNDGEVSDVEYGADGLEIYKSDVRSNEYIDNYWEEEKRRQTE